MTYLPFTLAEDESVDRITYQRKWIGKNSDSRVISKNIKLIIDFC